MKKVTLFMMGIFAFFTANAQGVSTHNETASGSCNGYAILQSSFAYSSWQWKKDTTLLQNGGDTLFSLCAGVYELHLDSFGMMSTKIFNIGTDTASSNPCTNSTLAVSVSSTNTTNGSCVGTATATPTGGTGPYMYSWGGGSSNTTASATGLCAGGFYLFVTDANGCSKVAQGYIAVDTMPNGCNLTITAYAVKATTNSSCDGSASAYASGGSGNYSYSWSNGSTNMQLSGLCIGGYTVVVSDTSGCIKSTSVIVSSNDTSGTCTGLNVNVNGSSSVSSCSGAAYAMVTGGSGTYTYSWSNGYATQSVYSLCPGTYYVYVVDANGCTGSGYKVIAADSLAQFPLHVNVSTSDASQGNCDGMATALVYGGTAPYTYMYSNGQTTATTTGLCAGYYSVAVTDANNQKDSAYFVIVSPNEVYQDTTNSPYQDSVVVATVDNEAIESCSFDYTTIDSVLVNNFSLNGADSIMVTWHVYNNGTTTTVVSVYAVGPTGVYNLILELFCDGTPKKAGATGFLKAIDQVYVNTNVVTGIASANKTQAGIYPVPFHSAVNVQLNENATVSMFDLLGKQVITNTRVVGGTVNTINAEQLPAGYYLLKIETVKAIEYVKVLKD